MLGDHLVAAAWGLAEGTAFFIVPDVWLTWVAIRRPRRALAATVSTLAGAMAGGVITYRWAASREPRVSASAMARVPGIDLAMTRRVDQETASYGARAVLRGPAAGIPYKLYARSAGVQGVPLPQFLAWTVPARMARFVLLVVATAAARSAAERAGLLRDDRGLPRLLGVHPEAVAHGVHVAGWATFYLRYLTTMGRGDRAIPDER